MSRLADYPPEAVLLHKKKEGGNLLPLVHIPRVKANIFILTGDGINHSGWISQDPPKPRFILYECCALEVAGFFLNLSDVITPIKSIMRDIRYAFRDS